MLISIICEDVFVIHPVADAVNQCSIFSLISFSHVKVQLKKVEQVLIFCEINNLVNIEWVVSSPWRVPIFVMQRIIPRNEMENIVMYCLLMHTDKASQQ